MSVRQVTRVVGVPRDMGASLSSYPSDWVRPAGHPYCPSLF